MEIAETINKWFEETENKLREFCPPKTNADKIVFPSIAVIDNYFNSALLILKKERRLPAMALLRITGEFIAKLIYCLQGNGNGITERIESWEKTSLMKRKKLYENIIDRYSGCNRKKVQRWIDETNKEINKIRVKGLSDTASIFTHIFGQKHPVGRTGMYLQYLGAVHIDLETLAKTIKKETTGTEYIGDVEYNIEGLKFECLTHAYIFLKHLYKHYNLDFQEIENEYEMLIPKS